MVEDQIDKIINKVWILEFREPTNSGDFTNVVLGATSTLEKCQQWIEQEGEDFCRDNFGWFYVDANTVDDMNAASEGQHIFDKDGNELNMQPIHGPEDDTIEVFSKKGFKEYLRWSKLHLVECLTSDNKAVRTAAEKYGELE